MIDGVQDRVREWLADMRADTPVSEVGAAFDVAFADDEEVSGWARRSLAIDLWRKFSGKGRPSIARIGPDGLPEQLRLNWHLYSLDEIDQVIRRRLVLIRGNRRALRDFGRIRAAMVAFPGVPAGEAARLAGVRLEVLTPDSERAA
ncbi:MAG: hypothetical protein H0V50_02820 [Thermoleophilaceae bacterium]|nr:hypothetical protein [Thermoleophilaceae bacterium]